VTVGHKTDIIIIIILALDSVLQVWIHYIVSTLARQDLVLEL
jgi:hypothetical protein